MRRSAGVLDDVLGAESRLAEDKVFDRSDVIVAVAPHLHGLPVSELDSAVSAVIADDRCIPLLGVAGARTQAYATAGVLAAEAHIAALATELATQPAAGRPRGPGSGGDRRRRGAPWRGDDGRAA